MAVYLGVAIAAGAIVLFLANSVVNITGQPTGSVTTTATGTATFAGNVSNGDLVNLTFGTAVYRFEFNTTSFSEPSACLTANCISINVTVPPIQNGTYVDNTTANASKMLTQFINSNATTSTLVTATNSSTVTSLTAAFAGATGNNIVLSKLGTNIAVSGLSGGRNATTAGLHLSNASNNLLATADTGYSFLPIVAIAAIGAIAIGFVFGLIPGFGRKGEGGGGI